MADPFVAEIRIVPFNFPPTGWAMCNGQLMPISQNTALFALLGTTYGGDGKSTFALPDLRGMTAMHPGQGQGLSLRDLGQIGGSETVTLLQSEIPVHTHTAQGFALAASTKTPSAETALARGFGGSPYKVAGTNMQMMAPQTLSLAGGGLPHNNLMPYLTMLYIIAMQGVFPQRP